VLFSVAKEEEVMKERTAQEWVDVINYGLEFRKVFGLEDIWSDLEAKFFSIATSCDTGPNIISSKGDTMISALSVPEVAVMVEPRTERSALTAPIVESFDNAMLKGLDVSDIMEDALTSSYLFGVGFIKLGYDSEFGYDPRFRLGQLGGTMTQFDDEGGMIESGIARSGLPWAAFVLPHNVVVPWGTRDLATAPQVFHRVVRKVEEVRADPKYNEKAGSLQGRVTAKELLLGLSHPRESVEERQGQTEGKGKGEQDFIELWEIMDRESGKVIVVALDEQPVIIRNVINTLQIDNVLPWVDVCLGLRTRAFWTTPVAYYAAPHQNELDDIHLQAKRQRRASILKLIAKKEAFSPEARAALLNGTPGMLVELEEIGVPLDEIVKYIGGNVSINTLLHQEEDVIHQNAREALGISRNLSGEYSEFSRTTATETNVVTRGGELRLGRKQKSLRKSYRDFVRILNNIVAAHWTVPQSVKVVGAEGGERWEMISAEILSNGRFSYKISFSTEHYATPFTRQETAMQLYANLSSDPRIDKQALFDELLAAYNRPGVRKVKKGGSGAVRTPMSEVPEGGRGSPSGGTKELAGGM